MTCTELTPKQTHRHTHSEETEESLFYFSVVFFMGSRIGGFQQVNENCVSNTNIQKHVLFTGRGVTGDVISAELRVQKILNGSPAQPGSHPYIALIVMPSYFCGGTLISR